MANIISLNSSLLSHKIYVQISTIKTSKHQDMRKGDKLPELIKSLIYEMIITHR